MGVVISISPFVSATFPPPKLFHNPVSRLLSSKLSTNVDTGVPGAGEGEMEDDGLNEGEIELDGE